MKQFQFSKIKQFRKAMGLSQHDLGERLGVYPQQISTWECGKVKGMTLCNLAKLCEVFGKSTEDFFKEDVK